jgi:hypothetical protein
MGSDFLIDGGVTAAYWYGALAPKQRKNRAAHQPSTKPPLRPSARFPRRSPNGNSPAGLREPFTGGFFGAAFVGEATRWRCPRDVVLRPVVDLSLAIDFSLVWRNDNASPLLARFAAGVRQNASASRS